MKLTWIGEGVGADWGRGGSKIRPNSRLPASVLPTRESCRSATNKTNKLNQLNNKPETRKQIWQQTNLTSRRNRQISCRKSQSHLEDKNLGVANNHPKNCILDIKTESAAIGQKARSCKERDSADRNLTLSGGQPGSRSRHCHYSMWVGKNIILVPFPTGEGHFSSHCTFQIWPTESL